ncbi:uncharacterized protein N7484_000544 [Penicillium longicatenatum]|uniref:uncharacterized protein n=1 Tax=Penicillium longicatenatum TaxID=1561947 RepID=UPI0025499C5F|nr:uncharacterized protein N7484_000544 [Penicillium longicatenatum]KAJ5661172.1 hypothetical protein N7484_000544 [Penicillium longicatenatum]
MYAKSCLALLAVSWVFLGSVAIGAHEIAARDLAELEGRDAAVTVVTTKVSSSCRASPPAGGVKRPPVLGSSTSPAAASAASSTDICPLASALCAKCPVSTTTVTVSSCPSTSAGGGSASATGQRSSSAPSIRPGSSEPPSSSHLATSSASLERPSSTFLEPSTHLIQSSKPLIGSRTAPPASAPTGNTLQTLPTGPGAGAPGTGARTGSTITPRAPIPPGIVRRQLIGVMNITAPFANTSSILTNATSTLNVTRILTSATTTESTGFRFHLRNRV